jgi:transcriptional regulator with XRE-family HTH domain
MNEKKLKDFRTKNNISQEKLAEMLGVSLRTIQNYERGGVIPKSKYAILRKTLTNVAQDNSNKREKDTNLIDKIAQQAEQIGILKNENRHQNELIKKLNAENERLKNENGKLRSGTGEHGRTTAKVHEMPEFPKSLVAEPSVIYKRDSPE